MENTHIREFDNRIGFLEASGSRKGPTLTGRMAISDWGWFVLCFPPKPGFTIEVTMCLKASMFTGQTQGKLNGVSFGLVREVEVEVERRCLMAKAF
ncbi:hypothetical protein EYR41_001632 [Orbilia oligospora]|uniref:Uncharacterized protein n=1 Tax=Orbilia oligospora TaxID=2813651 RepID=A0A7C8KN91_ORBOL|nr:hypothetical protein TWF751_007596 [Orbilia oligospora]KAF3247188.1 hypothetical protein TWF128_008684 [Orbilia oligospora]KAF3262838.1 hypothetical protein TWF217_004130 [Orbilia oligospora]TGJ74657.1 hypothetical protein EYR41_001632 [Orbilia oligospora]